MTERHSRESALARLNQLQAEFSEENSSETQKFYYSGSTGLWIEARAVRGGYELDFFQECPCTRKSS